MKVKILLAWMLRKEIFKRYNFWEQIRDNQ